MLRNVTISRDRRGSRLESLMRRATVSPAPRQSAMASPSIASLFAARLAELEREHAESERKTAETLASVRATIAELEALELPLD